MSAPYTPLASLDLIAKFRAFQESYDPDSALVYYPSCGVEKSPSVAFPSSRVVYVDSDPQAVSALKQEGLEAYQGDLITFKPDREVSILILLHPNIHSVAPRQFVSSRGYVLCDDLQNTASEIRTLSDFEFVGLITLNNNQNLVERDELDDLWNEVETDLEFQSAPILRNSVTYEAAANIVEQLKGKRDNVLEDYMRLLAQAKNESEESNRVLKQQHPEMASLAQGQVSTVYVLNYNGKQYTLPPLPRKRGEASDLYVFRRIG